MDKNNFLFHSFFARLGYILQSGAGALLCFLLDALLVTGRLGLVSPDKLSGLLVILKMSENQTLQSSHSQKTEKRQQNA